MAEECRLPLQSEKALSYTIKPHLLAYSTRTDLLAVVTQDEVLEVYRIGGQRAFVVKRKSPSTVIVGLEWIRDGWFPWVYLGLYCN
jgi:anaphase-promoting complex subunit 4